ncbi:putative serine protease PepD [Kineosphaera limosa]|uniref:Putative peptidase S1 family protein n=1 Tax=Kineosphaera limosa NBRC 100340 TaxID=1184609 RepID=K6XGJ1_9MICO|nr:trypsin-like peptidase domain-containing protein [Kineosphaera limosa]NYE01873.1 putative serine protease PepD [Kineosphaera limosa]GAB97944.1 putative peptidase S1 family protein [Kineosphaera limosa NBRC 100340]
MSSRHHDRHEDQYDEQYGEQNGEQNPAERPHGASGFERPSAAGGAGRSAPGQTRTPEPWPGLGTPAGPEFEAHPLPPARPKVAPAVPAQTAQPAPPGPADATAAPPGDSDHSYPPYPANQTYPANPTYPVYPPDRPTSDAPPRPAGLDILGALRPPDIRRPDDDRETPDRDNPLRTRRRRVMALLIAALFMGIAGGAGTVVAISPLLLDSVNSVRQQPPSGTTVPAPGAEAAAASIMPSVVQVSVGTGSGSGFVLDGRGHVMTNHHVIEGASTAQLTLSSGRRISATVVGSSEADDIAILRADPAALTPAAIGRSADLRIGQGVLSVGSPLGLQGTVTSGIVSAVDRSARLGGQTQRVVQTDAPINPGNSGGPLVNLDGQVVGVNTAIATLSRRSGGSIGIGFAVPIDRAVTVAERIIDAG